MVQLPRPRGGHDLSRLRAPDEDAVFPVFEAVLVAVLILTTILFFTSLQRPTTSIDAGGIDLGRVADDTLDVLQQRTFNEPPCLPGLGFEGWVNATLRGDACAAAAIESFITEVLPPGSQFLVRLDNGVAPLVLLPYGSDDAPRGARAAETYITPLWRNPSAVAATQTVHPGQAVTSGPAAAWAAAPCAGLTSPQGSATGPGGVAWSTFWASEPATTFESTTYERVPASVPYGVWTCGAQAVRVGLPDGTATDHVVYGVQLVVWYAA